MSGGFEGFANKEESTGKSLFHKKHSPMAVPNPPKAIQGFKKSGKRFARKPAPVSLD